MYLLTGVVAWGGRGERQTRGRLAGDVWAGRLAFEFEVSQSTAQGGVARAKAALARCEREFKVETSENHKERLREESSESRFFLENAGEVDFREDPRVERRVGLNLKRIRDESDVYRVT